MKIITFITGALFSSLTLLGILFEIMHWPGASFGIVLGLAGLALIFIPCFSIYKFKNDK